MRRGGLSGLLVLIYVIIGAFVAGTHGYFGSVSTIEGVASALLAILLWPLVLLGVSLKL
jgi:lipopolysaccharide export LptBFGC system permease protein LptF